MVPRAREPSAPQSYRDFAWQLLTVEKAQNGLFRIMWRVIAWAALLVPLALAVPVVLYVIMPGSPLVKACIGTGTYALTGVGLFFKKRQRRR